jgi:membrane protein YdbS with pleckstrin-like domain
MHTDTQLQQSPPERAGSPGEALRPASVAAPAAEPRIDPNPLPHPNLLLYYFISSLVLGPFFWAILIPRYFRYRTLRYRFDEEGVSMRWGILFRREISLTYARIQDIHLSSNVVERWLGLAKIQVQTASGSASAEMTIEGLQEFEQLRDYLYSKMRGAREAKRRSSLSSGDATIHEGGAAGTAGADELVATLRAVVDEVRALRTALLETRSSSARTDHE